MRDLDLEPVPMSDDIGDMASTYSENDLKIALFRHRNDNIDKELPFTGFCYYCDEPLDNRHRFCKTDEDGFSCAEEYQKEQDAKKRNGNI